MTKAKDTPENIDYGNTYRLLAVDPAGNVVRLPTDDLLRSGIGGILGTDDDLATDMISIAGPTTIDVKGGTAVIYKRDTYLSSGTGVITKKTITWSATTLTIPGLGNASPVIVDEFGTISFGRNEFTNMSIETAKDHIQLGTLGEDDMGGIILVDAAIGISAMNNDINMFAMAEHLGVINSPDDPFEILPSITGTGLQLRQTAGSAFIRQAGLGIDFLLPNVFTAVEFDPLLFVLIILRDQSFSVAAGAEIDPTQYESSPGTLSPVTGGKFTIQTIYNAPKAKLLQVFYGDAEYNSMAAAESALPAIVVPEVDGAQDNFLASFLIIKNSTTDLTVTADAKFILP